MGHTPVSYITIEVGTKPKPYYTENDPLHRNYMYLLCCYESSMVRVEICKEKESKYDDTEPDVMMIMQY